LPAAVAGSIVTEQQSDISHKFCFPFPVFSCIIKFGIVRLIFYIRSRSIMLEIIVFIIIIMAVVQSSKKKNTRRQAPPFTARPQRPSGSFSSRPAQPSKPLVSGARQKKQKKNASGRKAKGASPVQA